MTISRVLWASIHRRSVILAVDIEESDDRVGPDFEIEGQPGKKLEYPSGRVVDEDDTISNKRVLIMEPTGFSVEELVGRRILSK